VVGSEAGQRRGQEVPDRRRARVEPVPAAGGVAEGAELHAQRDGVAVAILERTPDQQLVPTGAVEVGRVDQRDARVDGRVDGGDALAVVGSPVEVGHAHRSEADGRCARAGEAEVRVSICVLLW
jgi:hypothetical protein